MSVGYDTLEERLAAIIQPKTGENAKSLVETMTVVDSFLAEKGSKQVLKKAIEFVKPFFFSMTDELLTEKAREIMHGFNVQDSNFLALEHFLVHKDFPDILESGIIQKVMNYHDL